MITLVTISIIALLGIFGTFSRTEWIHVDDDECEYDEEKYESGESEECTCLNYQSKTIQWGRVFIALLVVVVVGYIEWKLKAF
jgi:hypothetical protein